jgi:hypothetical protein
MTWPREGNGQQRWLLTDLTGSTLACTRRLATPGPATRALTSFFGDEGRKRRERWCSASQLVKLPGTSLGVSGATFEQVQERIE